MTEAKELVRAFIVRDFLFGDDNGLDDATSFLDTGIIDSTGILELVDFLEKEFSVEIADDELIPENLDSLASIAAYLQRKVGFPQPPMAPREQPWT